MSKNNRVGGHVVSDFFSVTDENDYKLIDNAAENAADNVADKLTDKNIKEATKLVSKIFGTQSECAFTKEQGAVCSPKHVINKMASFLNIKDVKNEFSRF